MRFLDTTKRVKRCGGAPECRHLSRSHHSGHGGNYNIIICPCCHMGDEVVASDMVSCLKASREHIDMVYSSCFNYRHYTCTARDGDCIRHHTDGECSADP